MNNPPNIIYLLPDQLGSTWMGTYGHPDVSTPRIDALAERGVVFERAYTASPLCTPARGSIWTSRYPRQTGITNNHNVLPRTERTIAHAFNEAGYQTLYLGKWHLNGGGSRGVPPEARGGFQRFYGWEAFHVDHWDGSIWGDDLDSEEKLPGHETDGLTGAACEWLRAHKNRQPFFMTVNYQAPHAPCSPPDRFREMYQDRKLHVRPNVNTDAYMQPQYGGQTRKEWNRTWQQFVEGYYGEISHLDASIGDLLDTLDNLNLSKNTIVILHSDHGENAGAHGRFEKHVVTEESIAVPLIIRDPRLPGGFRRNDLVSSIDIAPTILDLAGLDPLANGEGVSHAGAVRSEKTVARESMIVEFKTLCLIRDHLKLEASLDGKSLIALYDLKADPYELINFLKNPEYIKSVNLLHHELQQTIIQLESRAKITS